MKTGSRTWTGPSPSYAVITAVAEAEGVEPPALRRPLHAAIDPDALDGLFVGRDDAVGRVQFRFHGYTVTVEASGAVTLDDGSADR